MPPIEKQFLDCAIYLYASEQHAKDGAGSGGSGFLVHVASEHQGYGYMYAVTNKHVLDKGGLVLRLATPDGKTDTITTERTDWFDHPNRYDVAVLPISLEASDFKWSSVSVEDFITRDIIEDYNIGPGDDALLIGRLITPWGQQKNSPAARFGNISMMTDAEDLIRGYEQVEYEAFLVECRSLSGFSGSPVFVETTQHYHSSYHVPKRYKQAEGMAISLRGTWGPWLLGIDCGHLPLWKPIYSAKDFNARIEHHWVEQNTGIACVLPAWEIRDLLNEPELAMIRKRDDKKIDRQKQESIVLDSVEDDEPQMTKDSFIGVLKKVSQKVSEPESKDSEASESR